jgi:TolA-binding protein
MKYKAFLTAVFIFLTNSLFSQTKIDFYASGMKYFNSGDYSTAISQFNNLIFSDDVDEDLISSAHIYIGESLLGLNQVDGAISKFEQFTVQFPTSNLREIALYRLGNLYFEIKLYDRSRTNLIELVRAFPNSEYSGSAFHLIGETFIEENDLDKAEEFFNSAVNSKERNSFVDNSIYSLANLYEKKGQYTDAVKYYDKLLGFHKDSELTSQAQLRIGICYFYLKEYDNAVLELSDPLIQDLNIDQQNEANYILANTFYRLKEYDSATNSYQRILNNSPNAEMLDRIRYGLAWIYFQKANYDDSYKLFNQLAESTDDSIAVKSLYWSAESKRYNGQFAEAIEIHKLFVEKYPNHPFAEKVKLNIGISKFSQSSFKESEENLLETINSPDPLAKVKSLTLLGEINLRKKEYRSATEFFKRGLLIPQIPIELRDRCYLGLGVSNFFMNNNIEALNNFNSISVTETEIDKNKLFFYLGEVNFYLGNFSIALANYNKVNNSDELVYKNSTYGKAYSYFNEKDFTKAAHYFSEFIKNYYNDDRTDECELRLADCFYGTKDFVKASSYYEKVLVKNKKFSTDERAFFNFAQSLFKQGYGTKAIQTLEDLQLRFPASKYSDDSQYLIGWINFQSGNFDEAIAQYTKLFSNYPKSILLPIAYYSIGDSYFNLGEYSKSIDSYNKVITLYPSSSYVYDAVNGIQYCFVVQDKQNEAINYLSNFISSNRNSSFLDKIQFKKAEIYYSAADYESAITEYENVINDYPNSSLIASSYYWMGKSALLLNKDEAAKRFFNTVINSSLNSEIGFSSVIELGQILRKKNLYQDELNLYDNVLPKITESKRIAEIKYIKAQNFIETEDTASAYKELNELVNKRDGSLFTHKAEIELGILELKRANYESSLYLLRDVVNNRKDDIAAQAQYYVGLNYFEQEKLPEAITELIRVRSLFSLYDEWYTKSLLLLGDCYVKINDKANAAEMYKAVLKRHRNNAIAKEAKDKLNEL